MRKGVSEINLSPLLSPMRIQRRLHLIWENGAAWSGNKDTQLVRIEYDGSETGATKSAVK